MIALAFLATVVNYLDRQALSVAAPLLRETFHMSNVEYSRVVSAFMLAYTISNGISGPIIDRLGTKAGYALSIAWWSIAALLHSFATGAWTLAIYRFLLGIGEAGNWPAAVKVVSEWFPTEERALASGIFNSGSSVGAIIAPPLVAWILLQYGWRQAFFAVGLSGLLWLVLWRALYFTPKPSAEALEPPVPVRDLIRNRFVVAFFAAKIFLDPVWYFYIFWFPEYLKRARHFDMASIGKYAWIPFLVAGLGNLFSGWLSAVLMRRGVALTIARKSVVTFFCILMAAAIPAVLAPDAWVSIGFVSIAMMGYTGAISNMLAFPADVFPRNAVASVWGLASMGAGFGGMIFSLITGWLVDNYSYVPVFFMFAVMPLICSLILWTWLGPISPASWARQRQAESD